MNTIDLCHIPLLTPGLQTLKFIGVGGPTGRGLWLRILDLAVVLLNPNMLSKIDNFIKI